MDGFAVRAADLAMATDESPARLAIVGESRAGRPWEGSMGPGEAIRISTGAMMPEQADAVVRLEEADEQADELVTGVRIQSGRDVRRAGEDIVPGQTVIPRGARIGAAELGVLASVGIAGVRCLRQPRVAVVTTGEELIEPDEPMRAGGVRNSNAWSLPTLALAAGGELILRRRVSDDREATEAAIGEALNADVIVVTGGVSVGAHDHVKSALRVLGAIRVFWGVALRPGRPIWFGVRESPEGGRSLVFGLPGNPVSALVTFLLFVRPALRMMQGVECQLDRIIAQLDSPRERLPRRSQLVGVCLSHRDDGWHAEPTRGSQGSHILTSMLGADGLAVIHPGRGRVAAGERVDVELLPRPS
jgi:molybdopterin molybdotransferase